MGLEREHLGTGAQTGVAHTGDDVRAVADDGEMLEHGVGHEVRSRLRPRREEQPAQLGDRLVGDPERGPVGRGHVDGHV